MALALLAEDLALEPGDPGLQRLDARGLREHHLRQPLRLQQHQFGGVGGAGKHGGGHRASCYARPRAGATAMLRIAVSIAL